MGHAWAMGHGPWAMGPLEFQKAGKMLPLLGVAPWDVLETERTHGTSGMPLGPWPMAHGPMGPWAMGHGAWGHVPWAPSLLSLPHVIPSFGPPGLTAYGLWVNLWPMGYGPMAHGP